MNYRDDKPQESLQPLAGAVTVCAMVDESGREEAITELMIRRACANVDSDQPWLNLSGVIRQSVIAAATRQTPVLPGGAAAKVIPFPLQRL